MRAQGTVAVLTLFIATLASTRTVSAQILETESARFLPRGGCEIGTGFEYQAASEGTERAVPFTLEYGLDARLMAMVEPVAYTAIRPKQGSGATGSGDLEVTASLLAREEHGGWPAMAVALESKIPTARNRLIGSGKTDFAGYLIGSRRIGHLDVHALVGYTIFGQPAGVTLKPIWDFAFATECSLGKSSELYGEVLANTTSTPEGADNPSSPIPEAVGGEVIGTVGFGQRVAPGLLLSFGLGYDNNRALQIRPGVTFWTR